MADTSNDRGSISLCKTRKFNERLETRKRRLLVTEIGA